MTAPASTSRTVAKGAGAALALLLCAVFLAARPAPAAAGSRTILPEQLRPAFSNDTPSVAPLWATSSDGTPATYWAPVKLPLGARVRSLELVSWGSGSPYIRAALLRARVGEGYAYYGPSRLLMVEDTTVNPVGNPPTVTATTTRSYPDSDLVVRRGYRYFVQVDVWNNFSFAKGVRIRFR